MAAEEQREEAVEGARAAAPAKERKRKRKDGGAAPEASAPAPLPGAGTAAGDKLREAMRAFEVGDYARVRARTRELETAADPQVREAAAELASRIAVDPVQVVVILACAAVLVAIAYVWIF